MSQPTNSINIPYIVLKRRDIYHIWYINCIRKKRTFLAKFWR
nr:MAG TPA: hypothetical protein [Caudoviricetes sp.]